MRGDGRAVPAPLALASTCKVIARLFDTRQECLWDCKTCPETRYRNECNVDWGAGSFWTV